MQLNCPKACLHWVVLTLGAGMHPVLSRNSFHGTTKDVTTQGGYFASEMETKFRQPGFGFV